MLNPTAGDYESWKEKTNECICNENYFKSLTKSKIPCVTIPYDHAWTREFLVLLRCVEIIQSRRRIDDFVSNLFYFLHIFYFKPNYIGSIDINIT